MTEDGLITDAMSVVAIQKIRLMQLMGDPKLK
jgi:hypothetical protein